MSSFEISLIFLIPAALLFLAEILVNRISFGVPLPPMVIKRGVPRASTKRDTAQQVVDPPPSNSLTDGTHAAASPAVPIASSKGAARSLEWPSRQPSASDSKTFQVFFTLSPSLSQGPP